MVLFKTSEVHILKKLFPGNRPKILHYFKTVLIVYAYYLTTLIAVVPLRVSTWTLQMIFLKVESEIFLLVNPF